MWVTKLLISPGKIGILPEIGIFVLFGPGPAGSFGALLLGWLVVVARGLYLARHLFTLFYFFLCEDPIDIDQVCWCSCAIPDRLIS